MKDSKDFFHGHKNFFLGCKHDFKKQRIIKTRHLMLDVCFLSESPKVPSNFSINISKSLNKGD
jgi:hypothetical protein